MLASEEAALGAQAGIGMSVSGSRSKAVNGCMCRLAPRGRCARGGDGDSSEGSDGLAMRKDAVGEVYGYHCKVR